VIAALALRNSQAIPLSHRAMRSSAQDAGGVGLPPATSAVSPVRALLVCELLRTRLSCEMTWRLWGRHTAGAPTGRPGCSASSSPVLGDVAHNQIA
jgi:hypothetical protein